MKIIHEFRNYYGEDQHQLVAIRDDGTRVESGWVDDTEMAFLSDAAITHGHMVEENPHGPGYIAFTDYHPELPRVSRYEPFDDVHEEQIEEPEDDDDEDLPEDSED
jgi:hypothetical protein